jgi:hypothetical protein
MLGHYTTGLYRAYAPRPLKYLPLSGNFGTIRPETSGFRPRYQLQICPLLKAIGGTNTP